MWTLTLSGRDIKQNQGTTVEPPENLRSHSRRPNAKCGNGTYSRVSGRTFAAALRPTRRCFGFTVVAVSELALKIGAKTLVLQFDRSIPRCARAPGVHPQHPVSPPEQVPNCPSFDASSNLPRPQPGVARVAARLPLRREYSGPASESPLTFLNPTLRARTSLSSCPPLSP
jgi:hypothetical protein